jgi:hypothetical protein
MFAGQVFNTVTSCPTGVTRLGNTALLHVIRDIVVTNFSLSHFELSADP